jgi:hydrogenase nickel incorporation protein HypA/HybF
MHEMSIAVNIVDIAVEAARKADAEKINEIVVEIGTLSGIIPESLEFGFSSACKDTMARDARLALNIIPAIAFCEQCGHRFETDSHAPLCPNCDNLCLQIRGGREMKIKSINVD